MDKNIYALASYFDNVSSYLELIKDKRDMLIEGKENAAGVLEYLNGVYQVVTFMSVSSMSLLCDIEDTINSIESDLVNLTFEGDE